MPTVWTDEMRATAAGMKRAGLPTKVIAARLGVSPSSVAHCLTRIGARRTAPVGPTGTRPGRLSVVADQWSREDDFSA